MDDEISIQKGENWLLPKLDVHGYFKGPEYTYVQDYCESCDSYDSFLDAAIDCLSQDKECTGINYFLIPITTDDSDANEGVFQ